MNLSSMPQPVTHRRHSACLKADLMLALVAVIWGSAFVVQRLAAADIGVFLFNGMRFLLAAVALAPVAWSGAFTRKVIGEENPVDPLTRRNVGWAVLAGVLLFSGAALQQAGMIYTTAGNAGFITGLYVLFIPLILAVIFHQRPRAVIWFAAGLAVAGLYMLSTGGKMSVNRGDVLELVGAVFWALHVILIGRVVQRINVLQFAVAQYVACSLINIAVGLILETSMLPAFMQGWWLVAYTGLISVGLGYTLQAIAQREAPPADAAILLSMESAVAAICGWIFLGEALTPIQIAGCVVMMTGMLLAQLSGLRES